MKQWLKQTMGPAWELRVRQLRRLRWLTKYRLMRELPGNASLAQRLAYVLLDPELESFSFELADEPGVIRELAAALGCSESQIAGYAAEPRCDPELNTRLARHVRWRFDFKRHMPIGSRLASYLAVRALKPELVVETGIYMGLGSLVILRALEHNRKEGHPGELMSFDANPVSGLLVRKDLRDNWQRVIGLTSETLRPALRGRKVGLLLHDTLHTEEIQRLEFKAAIDHAAPRLMLVDGSGGYVPALAELCRARNGSYHSVRMSSRAHIHPGADFRFGIFDHLNALK